jgi:uncharacterized protein (TIGR00730 family)
MNTTSVGDCGSEENLKAILNSPAYRKAEDDPDLLQLAETRPIRMGLEVLKPELTMRKEKIDSTIVLFGGTRILEETQARKAVESAREALEANPSDKRLKLLLLRAENVLSKSRYYEEARKFSELVSKTSQKDGFCHYVIVTGGGPGIMEAGNRGACEAGAKSIGLNVTLPFEQVPNAYITPGLCFQFRYFAIRKVHFLLRARAMVAFPGGFGTLDELFETLTLIQTQIIEPIPVVLFGEDYWSRLINFDVLVEEGTIDPEDLDLFAYADTAEDAWRHILEFNSGLTPERHPNGTRNI